MAEEKAVGAPALDTNIETGGFDEKRGQAPPPTHAPKAPVAEDEEPDEDMDALIEDLESEDGHAFDEEEETQPGGGRVVPEDQLQTDSRVGLTEAEVINRRRKWGLNQMKEERENMILKFLMFFVGPIQFVMEAAAVLAAGLEDWIDFGVICALLLLNACVGFIQEFQAGSIVEELKKTLALKAVVLRDGTLKEVEAPEVVPGDILQVEEGTIIPADGRFVTEGCFVQVDQSAITGESLAVDKHAGDNCYASSAVKRGEAFVIVTATGDNTFVGRAAALVSQSAGGTGHFTEVLNGIGTILLVLVVATLLIVWVSSFYRSNGIVDILRFTLAITIVGVPVGLPAVVTTTMAVGAAYLAKKQAIVQKLSAIESLAGVEILCSDKTGTLTKNKLSLAEPFCVAGVEPDGSKSSLSELVDQHRPDLQPLEELYKHLHRNPELSNQEIETAATIAQRLKEIGPDDLIIKPHIGGHGLAAVLRNGDGPTVLLRADIDALPVEETTGLEYASTKRMIHAASGVEKPVMHACGHDMHIVTLLGAAATLFSSRDHWAGTLVLAFQPAEERGTGAQAMVDDGLYTKHEVPVPEFVLGAHVRPLRAGTIGTRRGLVATSADNYKVTIHGKGSHASMPHTAIDPIAISANAILKLQTLVSREVDPAESSVVTVTSIHAGDAENVIADSAVLGVDTRSTTIATRERLLKRIKTVIEAECSCANVLKNPEFEQTRAFPLTINDEGVTKRVEESFAAHFGEEPRKYDRNMPKLAFSEDFSILATAVDKPYCFFTYGCVDGEVWDKAEKDGTVAQSIAANHSSKFAPVIQPTLKTGLDGYALGALTFLAKVQ